MDEKYYVEHLSKIRSFADFRKPLEAIEVTDFTYLKFENIDFVLNFVKWPKYACVHCFWPASFMLPPPIHPPACQARKQYNDSPSSSDRYWLLAFYQLLPQISRYRLQTSHVTWNIDYNINYCYHLSKPQILSMSLSVNSMQCMWNWRQNRVKSQYDSLRRTEHNKFSFCKLK